MGKIEQKVLKLYCLSKVAHEGKITLFYNGGGIDPVNNYHSTEDIYCVNIPFTKYNPKASLSFLNKALEILLKTILFISNKATSNLLLTLFLSIISFGLVVKHAKNSLVKYFSENRYILLIFQSSFKIK